MDRPGRQCLVMPLKSLLNAQRITLNTHGWQAQAPLGPDLSCLGGTVLHSKAVMYVG